MGDIGYMNIETGELLTRSDMLSQFKTEYDEMIQRTALTGVSITRR